MTASSSDPEAQRPPDEPVPDSEASYPELIKRYFSRKWPAIVAVFVVAVALRFLLEPGGAQSWIAVVAVVVVFSVVADRYARLREADARKE